MIVKNEEKSLPTCLKSIQDYVNEIVIVDTGSTDRTVQIAESFGANVYHHPWEHHFSKHRNQSFGYAGGDWILYIDADEELLPGSGRILRDTVFAAGEDVDAVAVVLECIYNRGAAIAANNSIRVFRNHRGLRYEGRVHNHIVGVKKAVCAPIRIFHHGYILDKKTRVRRFQRTTHLLKREIQDNPDNPRPHHFLAASYLSEKMIDDALKSASTAISLYEKQNNRSHNYLWSIYIAASAFMETGDLSAAEKLARKGVNVNKEHLDSHYLLAVIAYKKKNESFFNSHLKAYLKILELIKTDPARFGEMVHNTYASQWYLYFLEGSFMIHNGETEAAPEKFKESEALCPDPLLFQLNLAGLHVELNQYTEAKRAYLKALEHRPDDTKTLWALSYVYEKLNQRSDHIGCIEKILQIDPEFRNGHFQLGLAYMNRNNFEEAIRFFRKAQHLDPYNQVAKINEALCMRGLKKYDAAILLFEKINPANDDEKRVLRSNLAFCHYELKNQEQAIDSFLEMAKTQPAALEPPVFLAKLFIDKGDIEACVAQCDRLLTLLGIPENRTLRNLEELGALFHKVGHVMASINSDQRLIDICLEIGNILGCKPKKSHVSSS